jgi:antitoxin MazE
MKTRIAEWGNSQGVRLPREALEEAGLAIGDTVRVEASLGQVTLEKTRRIRGRYRLEDLVAKVPENHTPEEEDWGAPVGQEVW